jgi:hypothetical protein
MLGLQRQHFQGWRSCILSGTILCLVVFSVNLILTIIATFSQKDQPGYRKVLYKGNCTKVQRLNAGGHVIISILSTCLLSASNYTMQCLSAPTRKEVDEAHAQCQLLEIGVMSIRNLRFKKKITVIMWAILCVSSLPLSFL